MIESAPPVRQRIAPVGPGTLMLDLLFGIWILSLPFYLIPIAGQYSLDNLLAPALAVLWLLAWPTMRIGWVRGRHLWIVGLLCGAYMFFNVAGTLLSGTFDTFAEALRLEVRVILYFMLPLLYVGTLRQFRFLATLLTFDTAIVCVTAVASALGWIDVNVHVARLDLGIGRSLGLIGISGPFAVLVLVSMMALRTAPFWEQRRWLHKRSVRIAVYLTLVVGMLAAQSRNVVLSMVLFLVLFELLQWFRRRPGQRALAFLLVGVPVAIGALAFGSFLVSEAYDAIVGQGAMRGSVEDRLIQYREAWILIAQHPFGAPAEARAAHEKLYDAIHSLWLGVLLKGGMPALLVLLGLLGKGFVNAWGLLRSASEGRDAAGSIALLISVAFAGSFFVAQHNLIFWVCLAVPFAWSCRADLVHEPAKRRRTVEAAAPESEFPRALGTRDAA